MPRKMSLCRLSTPKCEAPKGWSLCVTKGASIPCKARRAEGIQKKVLSLGAALCVSGFNPAGAADLTTTQLFTRNCAGDLDSHCAWRPGSDDAVILTISFFSQ